MESTCINGEQRVRKGGNMFKITVTKQNGEYRGTTSNDRHYLTQLEGRSIYNVIEHARICKKVEQYGFYLAVDNNKGA